MPSVPIPIFASLVLMFLFIRLLLNGRGKTPLAILLAACAVQVLIISLTQHYMVTSLRFVQPITASMIAPLAWWAYQTTAVRAPQRADLMHGLVPLTALAALVTAPIFLDVFIPGVFVVYGLTIIFQSLKGPDAQPFMAFENAELPSRIWLIIGVFLILSAISDILIVGFLAMNLGHFQPWIISIFSVGNLLLVGILSLSGYLETPAPEASKILKNIDTPPIDEEIWQKVQNYMADKKPYLDPDLTLVRLSRKLAVPSKTLSIAINRSTNDNVSRFINNARIEAAKTEMMKGTNVTQSMFSSGFNTKSNFNREFLRVTGNSPTAWLAAQKEPAQ
ncbi:MAG: helix-turn-helix domain-containing protein [Nitratireductor sp.]